eukprot:scaffold221823_cov26-Tisochrysis_lutea.AAC.1
MMSEREKEYGANNRILNTYPMAMRGEGEVRERERRKEKRGGARRGESRGERERLWLGRRTTPAGGGPKNVNKSPEREKEVAVGTAGGDERM